MIALQTFLAVILTIASVAFLTIAVLAGTRPSRISLAARHMAKHGAAVRKSEHEQRIRATARAIRREMGLPPDERLA